MEGIGSQRVTCEGLLSEPMAQFIDLCFHPPVRDDVEDALCRLVKSGGDPRRRIYGLIGLGRSQGSESLALLWQLFRDRPAGVSDDDFSVVITQLSKRVGPDLCVELLPFIDNKVHEGVRDRSELAISWFGDCRVWHPVLARWQSVRDELVAIGRRDEALNQQVFTLSCYLSRMVKACDSRHLEPIVMDLREVLPLLFEPAAHRLVEFWPAIGGDSLSQELTPVVERVEVWMAEQREAL